MRSCGAQHVHSDGQSRSHQQLRSNLLLDVSELAAFRSSAHAAAAAEVTPALAAMPEEVNYMHKRFIYALVHVRTARSRTRSTCTALLGGDILAVFLEP